jgi:hypothetical protein
VPRRESHRPCRIDRGAAPDATRLHTLVTEGSKLLALPVLRIPTKFCQEILLVIGCSPSRDSEERAAGSNCANFPSLETPGHTLKEGRNKGGRFVVDIKIASYIRLYFLFDFSLWTSLLITASSATLIH